MQKVLYKSEKKFFRKRTKWVQKCPEFPDDFNSEGKCQKTALKKFTKTVVGRFRRILRN